MFYVGLAAFPIIKGFKRTAGAYYVKGTGVTFWTIGTVTIGPLSVSVFLTIS